jgi:hypothetical protein
VAPIDCAAKPVTNSCIKYCNTFFNLFLYTKRYYYALQFGEQIFSVLKPKIKGKCQRRRPKTRFEQQVQKDVMWTEGRTWKKTEDQQLWEENSFTAR